MQDDEPPKVCSDEPGLAACYAAAARGVAASGDRADQAPLLSLRTAWNSAPMASSSSLSRAFGKMARALSCLSPATSSSASSRLSQKSLHQCSEFTDEFSEFSGEKLPSTVDNLGTLLSILFRISCCSWGCHGGDHQFEWLVGRVTNQAMAATNLIRSAFYDESLMLTRGIGEIADLFRLFSSSKDEFEEWRRSTKKQRLNKYGPAPVRKKLEQCGANFSIGESRYQKLCEVGTHPIPGQIPGHYSGAGRPVLGGIPQPVGIYVCYTELGYAVASCGIFLSGMLHDQERKQQIFDCSSQLRTSLGMFSILTYEDLLNEVIEKNRNDENA